MVDADESNPFTVVGTPIETLAALEAHHGVSMPADFREYLELGAPEHNNSVDWPTEWWTIKRIKTIAEECDHPVKLAKVAAKADQYLVFADYAIWSMAWAISCAGDETHGRVMVINGARDRFVADSFAEFVDLHAEDAQALL
ncbi:MAG TPA: SMI1/KNR4 family protein [Hyphomonadaceae bacterium]|nr:SMI1/KNR4 family protein [Hyphomonadaceae bacterium]